jgi:ABC-type phosphate transport system substrate-binding protein
MKKTSLLAFALAFTATLWHQTSEAGGGEEIAVIVNVANPATRISREELRPLFQTTKTQWPDGTKAEPLNLGDENSVRQSFDAAVLGLDPDRVARYWVDRKIRGGERPPRKVAAVSSMLRGVATDRGGIGYVPAAEVTPQVKIIARVKNGQVVPP